MASQPKPKRAIYLSSNTDERYWQEKQLGAEQEQLKQAWATALADLRAAQDAMSRALLAGEPLDAHLQAVKTAQLAHSAAKADYDDHCDAWMRARNGAR